MPHPPAAQSDSLGVPDALPEKSESSSLIACSNEVENEIADFAVPVHRSSEAIHPSSTPATGTGTGTGTGELLADPVRLADPVSAEL